MAEINLNHKYSPLFDEDNEDRYFIVTGGR